MDIGAAVPNYGVKSDRHVVRVGIVGCSWTLVSAKEPKFRASLQVRGMAMKGIWGKTSRRKSSSRLKTEALGEGLGFMGEGIRFEV